MKRLFSLFKVPGLSLFTREVMLQPRHMGAALPSSRLLARAMAAQVSIEKDGIVIELGAGTGVVTAALLHRGINPENLIVIERSKVMAKYLRKRFPQLNIIEGDAANLKEIIPQLTKPVIAVVSSLPLLSLPKTVVAALTKQLDELIAPGNVVIQFTYGFLKRTSHFSKNFRKVYTQSVWFNFPPALVEVYKRIK